MAQISEHLKNEKKYVYKINSPRDTQQNIINNIINLVIELFKVHSIKAIINRSNCDFEKLKNLNKPILTYLKGGHHYKNDLFIFNDDTELNNILDHNFLKNLDTSNIIIILSHKSLEEIDFKFKGYCRCYTSSNYQCTYFLLFRTAKNEYFELDYKIYDKFTKDDTITKTNNISNDETKFTDFSKEKKIIYFVNNDIDNIDDKIKSIIYNLIQKNNFKNLFYFSNCKKNLLKNFPTNIPITIFNNMNNGDYKMNNSLYIFDVDINYSEFNEILKLIDESNTILIITPIKITNKMDYYDNLWLKNFCQIHHFKANNIYGNCHEYYLFTKTNEFIMNEKYYESFTKTNQFIMNEKYYESMDLLNYNNPTEYCNMIYNMLSLYKIYLKKCNKKLLENEGKELKKLYPNLSPDELKAITKILMPHVKTKYEEHCKKNKNEIIKDEIEDISIDITSEDDKPSSDNLIDVSSIVSDISKNITCNTFNVNFYGFKPK